LKHERKIRFSKIPDCYFVLFYFHVIIPTNPDLSLSRNFTAWAGLRL